jgi:two-component sensor histidine kinase
MPTFSKCGDNTAVNLEDAIVDNIIQSTFDNSQGIEKSPPFTETKGVGMSKIGKYSLRKRNKEKLRIFTFIII